jgi:hypothetical protein
MIWWEKVSTMRNKGNSLLKRLESILFAVGRRDPEEPDVSGTWQANLMRDVRMIGPLGGEAIGPERFGRLAWRFSLACGIGVAAVVIYTLVAGFLPFQDLAVALLDDPVTVLYSSLM